MAQDTGMPSMPMPGMPAQEPEKKRGLFQKKEPDFDYSGLAKDITAIGRRIRVLEDRYTNLNRKTQVTEQNMLNSHKKLTLDNKTIDSDLRELRRDLDEIKNALGQVVEELKKSARKEDVRMLEKYVNLWETVKFVTREQVETMVHDILEERENR